MGLVVAIALILGFLVYIPFQACFLFAYAF
jgi:hypothetical protein